MRCTGPTLFVLVTLLAPACTPPLNRRATKVQAGTTT